MLLPANSLVPQLVDISARRRLKRSFKRLLSTLIEPSRVYATVPEATAPPSRTFDLHGVEHDVPVREVLTSSLWEVRTVTPDLGRVETTQSGHRLVEFDR